MYIVKITSLGEPYVTIVDILEIYTVECFINQ